MESCGIFSKSGCKIDQIEEVLGWSVFIFHELACSSGENHNKVKERISSGNRPRYYSRVCSFPMWLTQTENHEWVEEWAQSHSLLLLKTPPPPSTLPPPPATTCERRVSQCGLDPSHSDSGCSPFEKLNEEGGGALAELNEAPRKEKKKKHAELSTAPTISITKEEVGAQM